MQPTRLSSFGALVRLMGHLIVALILSSWAVYHIASTPFVQMEDGRLVADNWHDFHTNWFSYLLIFLALVLAGSGVVSTVRSVIWSIRVGS